MLRCIACLDPKNSFANYDEDKLVDLASMYAADFSAYEVSFVLRNQLDSFIHEARVDPHLMNCNDLGHLVMNVVVVMCTQLFLGLLVMQHSLTFVCLETVFLFEVFFGP